MSQLSNAAWSGKQQSELQAPIFTREFALVCLTYFACFVILHLLVPTLPLYVQDLGGRDSDIGLVLGVSNLSSLGIRMIAGPILDIWGRKRPLIGGAIVSLVAMLGYSLMPGIPSLVLLRMLQGIGFGIVTTASSVLAADLAPLPRRGEAMSYYGNFASIAMAMAPGIGLWLIAVPGPPIGGFPLLFLACSAVALLGLLFAAPIKETHQPPASTVPRRRLSAANLFSRNAIPISVAMFFGAYTLGAISSFVPVYLTTANAQNVPIFFLVYATVMIVSRPLVGRIADRMDRRLVALPLMACCALGTSIFAIAPSLPVALAAGLVFGMGYGPLNATLLALVVDVVKPQERGAAMSIFMASVDLGLAVGSISLGLVADAHGYGWVFLTGGGVGLIGLIYFLIYRWLSPRHRAIG